MRREQSWREISGPSGYVGKTTALMAIAIPLVKLGECATFLDRLGATQNSWPKQRKYCRARWIC